MKAVHRTWRVPTMYFKALYLFYSHSQCKEDLVLKFQTCCAISAPHPNAWSRAWAWEPDQVCCNSRDTLWNLRGSLTGSLHTGSFLLVSNRSIVRRVTLILPFTGRRGCVWQRQILLLPLKLTLTWGLLLHYVSHMASAVDYEPFW